MSSSPLDLLSLSEASFVEPRVLPENDEFSGTVSTPPMNLESAPQDFVTMSVQTSPDLVEPSQYEFVVAAPLQLEAVGEAPGTSISPQTIGEVSGEPSGPAGSPIDVSLVNKEPHDANVPSIGVFYEFIDGAL